MKAFTAGQRAGAQQSDDDALVNLREIAEIELFIIKRMKEFTLGDHASVFKGSGFNFVGVRDWEPGDRMSSIDWAQSSMTNFSPMITRDFEQDSNATIVAVADASLSTRCGVHGVPIAAAIARAVAAAGLSAMFFQDLFGLVTFDDRFQELAAARPRIGRSHLLYCLDLYQNRRSLDPSEELRDIIVAIEGQLRKASLVPVISDFLFPDVERLVHELSLLNAVHVVCLLIADVRFAYQLPRVSDGWVEAYDVESGRTRVLSRRELRRLADERRCRYRRRFFPSKAELQLAPLVESVDEPGKTVADVPQAGLHELVGDLLAGRAGLGRVREVVDVALNDDAARTVLVGVVERRHPQAERRIGELPHLAVVGEAVGEQGRVDRQSLLLTRSNAATRSASSSSGRSHPSPPSTLNAPRMRSPGQARSAHRACLAAVSAWTRVFSTPTIRAQRSSGMPFRCACHGPRARPWSHSQRSQRPRWMRSENSVSASPQVTRNATSSFERANSAMA
jgi:hypothetical protein